MRPFFLTFFFSMAVSLAAGATEAPIGQVHIDAGKVLRGHFAEEHQMSGVNGPMRSTGHFVVAPAYGLIWGIEKPFPTSTIITSNGAIQDIGGMAMKLPIKNLRSLYDMVGGALAGDWSELEKDFTISRSGDAGHWQMLLTPREPGQSKLSYSAITVSGGPFVENIVMTKADGNYDTLSFTDTALSPVPLAAGKSMLFSEAAR